jgi:hypothetical protein
MLVLLKTARVFDERHFTKCFAKHFAKYVLLFCKTKGAVSVVSLFREMAHFGRKVFTETEKHHHFAHQREKHVLYRRQRAVEGTEGSRGAEGHRRGRRP